MIEKKVFRVQVLLLMDNSVMFAHESTASISMTIGEADFLFLRNMYELMAKHMKTKRQ